MRPSEILDMHREELRAVMKLPKHAEHFTNLRVFGSAATGHDTEQSDIDFLVDSKNKAYTLFDLSGLYYALETAKRAGAAPARRTTPPEKAAN